MRSRATRAAAVCLTAGTALFASTRGVQPGEDAAFERAEVTRLRAHFDSVLLELRRRDVAELRPAQRSARSELLQALTRYRDGGVFPHNHDSATATPYFRDEHGTLCAMAYLIATTGRHDIVDDIATQRNNDYIPELASDPRLGAWLDSVGLTVAEAARIQPEDGGGSLREERESARRDVLPSIAGGAAAIASAAVNWAAPPGNKDRRPVLIGALSSAASLFLGAAILSTDDEDWNALGAFDIGAGVAALGAVVQRGFRQHPPPESGPPVASPESRLSFEVAPVIHHGRIAPASLIRLRF